MNQLVLNIDTLLLTLSLAKDSSTKIALMSTCHVLHQEGVKLFSRDEDVYIETDRQLKSFLLFMSVDGFSRLRYLRSLGLAIDEGPSVERLKDMLIRLAPVSQLRCLTIVRSELLLDAYPTLSDQLTSITEIRLFGVGKHGLEMFKSMRSSVEKARIEMQTQRDGRWLDGDVIHLLRRSAPVSDGGSDSAAGPSQYLLMRSLALSSPHVPEAWHYVRAFPNLKDLNFTARDEPNYTDASLRAINASQLRQHGSWKSLDTFEGTVSALWNLGLSCPIRRQLLPCDDYPTELRDVLSDARPVILEARIYSSSYFLNSKFVSELTEPCASHLEQLALTVEMNSDEFRNLATRDIDLHDIRLETIVDMLRSFSVLKRLCLCLDFGASPARRYYDDVERISPVELDAEDMDMDAVCGALRDALPSANTVQSTLKEHPTRGTVTGELSEA